jgi:hypothetical protein
MEPVELLELESVESLVLLQELALFSQDLELDQATLEEPPMAQAELDPVMEPVAQQEYMEQLELLQVLLMEPVAHQEAMELEQLELHLVSLMELAAHQEAMEPLQELQESLMELVPLQAVMELVLHQELMELEQLELLQVLLMEPVAHQEAMELEQLELHLVSLMEQATQQA